MEANFAQDLLLQQIREKTQQNDLRIRKDNRKKTDKFGRLENLTPVTEAGRLRFCQKTKNTTDMNTLIDPLLAFERGSKAPDDRPDALEVAVYLLAKIQSFFVQFL